MVKNATKIIIKLLIIVIMTQIALTPFAYASIIGDADNFLNTGKEQGTVIDGEQLQSAVDIIYNILLAIGVSASVIVGTILGIQFMWGSIEAKTKAKEALMPYVIGCVVVFGAFGIWKMCLTLFSNI